MRNLRILMVTFIFIMAAGCSSRIMPLEEGAQIVESDQAQKGQKVFMIHCNRCHPGGMAGLGPAIINKPLPGFLIKFQVRNGLGVMPSFDKEHLSSEELDDLVEYLKEL